MATYDVTGPGGVNRPGRYNPGVRTPYLVENTIDVSQINSGAGSANGDILECIDIPAETLIIYAGVEVLTALSGSVTIDLGVTGADPDRYVDGDTNATGHSTLTNTARLVQATADTLDALLAGAASTVGKIRVWALLCDVAGVDESDRQSDAQHDTDTS